MLCYNITLPRREHNQPHAIKTKKKELENFEVFDVYEVVDSPVDDDILPTKWVLVQKEDDHGELQPRPGCASEVTWSQTNT